MHIPYPDFGSNASIALLGGYFTGKGFELESNSVYYGQWVATGSGTSEIDAPLAGELDFGQGDRVSPKMRWVPNFAGGYLSVPGVVTNDNTGQGMAANGFHGNGSALTGLPSTNVITGQLLNWQNILPASLQATNTALTKLGTNDGSALTNLTAASIVNPPWQLGATFLTNWALFNTNFLTMSGSNLLHLDATNLEGSLPSIPGTNLTGLATSATTTSNAIATVTAAVNAAAGWVTQTVTNGLIRANLQARQNQTIASITNLLYSTNANLQFGSVNLTNLSALGTNGVVMTNTANVGGQGYALTNNGRMVSLVQFRLLLQFKAQMVI